NHWKHTQTPACRKHPETGPNHTHATHGDTRTTHGTPQNNQTTARHTSMKLNQRIAPRRKVSPRQMKSAENNPGNS
ncbi:hypothetical protein QM008_00280, partial [Bifidobacterium angulatum]|uniref:hypothetical protein n=1 Tax=Bifidobacterium angulatum TaxID=1683 RepID=UPI00406BEC06